MQSILVQNDSVKETKCSVLVWQLEIPFLKKWLQKFSLYI